MPTVTRSKGKSFWWVLAAICLTVGPAVWMLAARTNRAATSIARPEAGEPPYTLAAGRGDCLELAPKLRQTLGVRTAQVQSASSHDHLNLSGSLFLDSNRLVRVHSRFAGEVVSIGKSTDASSRGRPLRLNDRVKKDQLLAVIWSKDVGEKKSDLVNARSKLYLAEAQLKSLQSLGADVIARQKIREAERDREEAIIEVDRLERTLRSWRLTETEIEAVRHEADSIHRGINAADLDVDKSWAEVEVRSPFDGIILEKNVVAGDIVDTNLDLFKIADLSELSVMAHVYEEDLPALESIPAADRRWTIQLNSQSGSIGIPGKFEVIGNIVDPTQHTAIVMGWIDNPDERLKAGQFITAKVPLPAAAGEVVIPNTALVDDGSRCLVFVASDSEASVVTRRKVAMAGRGPDVVYIRAEPTPHEALQGCEPLRAGEWVVAQGSIELDGALESALAKVAGREAAQH